MIVAQSGLVAASRLSESGDSPEFFPAIHPAGQAGCTPSHKKCVFWPELFVALSQVRAIDWLGESAIPFVAQRKKSCWSVPRRYA
jgi:hypothetical protein